MHHDHHTDCNVLASVDAPIPPVVSDGVGGCGSCGSQLVPEGNIDNHFRDRDDADHNITDRNHGDDNVGDRHVSSLFLFANIIGDQQFSNLHLLFPGRSWFSEGRTECRM